VRLAKLEVDCRIALGHVIRCREAECLGGLIDPARASFNLEEITNGCLIQHDEAGFGGLGIFRSEFFVTEAGVETEAVEDLYKGLGIVKMRFQFFAAFVFARFPHAFVAEQGSIAFGADAQQLTSGTETGVVGIEQHVGFEYALFANAELQFAQLAADRLQVLS